jgi:integral membrane protein (TIGR00529 family)
MNVFLPLSAAFLLIVVLLRKHVPIGACMLAAGLLLWITQSGEPAALFVAAKQTLSLSRTYDIMLALYFVMCLEIELRLSGTLSGMVNALRRVFSSAKALLALMPAFLGLLPSLGGARFSAPIVDELSADISMSQEHKAAINFWFRHIFEFSNPIIPGMIMACNIANVPFSEFLKHLSWLTILAFSIGWVILIRPLRLPDELKPKADGAQKKHEAADLVLALSPVVTTFLLAVFLDMNASLAMGIVTFLLFFVLRATNRFVSVRDTVVGALDKKMQLNVLCILYFIQILTVIGVLPEIVEAFRTSPLPVPVIIACVSFIIGVLTGMSQGHVAIVMPIVAAMGTGNLDLAGIAMAFGVAGQMLTPTHMCLVVTVDYFRSNFLSTLRPVLLGEIVLLTIFSIYTWFTMA